jgi:muramidase (phage lysozyme)
MNRLVFIALLWGYAVVCAIPIYAFSVPLNTTLVIDRIGDPTCSEQGTYFDFYDASFADTTKSGGGVFWRLRHAFRKNAAPVEQQSTSDNGYNQANPAVQGAEATQRAQSAQTSRNNNAYSVPTFIPIPERRIKAPIWQNMPTYSEYQVVSMAKEALSDPRVRAFLDLVARCEVADEGYDPESYRILHGFRRLDTYTKYHPGILSKGSTASGRYQMLKKTFNPLVNNYPSAHLTFRPEGQDLATVLLLHERHVLPYISQNDILGAIKRSATIWASFPYYEDGDFEGNLSYYRDIHKNRHILSLYEAINHYNRRLDAWLDAMPELYQTVGNEGSMAQLPQASPRNRPVNETPAVLITPTSAPTNTDVQNTTTQPVAVSPNVASPQPVASPQVVPATTNPTTPADPKPSTTRRWKVNG